MIKLPPLSYDYNALAPTLSEHQVRVHYDKHTKNYFTSTNKLITGTIYENVTDIESLLNKKTLSSVDSILFNTAAQARNHILFWNSISPNKDNHIIPTPLENHIKEDFGSVDKLKQIFVDKSIQHFGSGWCWIILKNGKMVVKTTPNATTVLVTPTECPLLVIDLWEHAYLYDPQYEADKKSYVTNIWNIINWNFAHDNYRSA